MKIVTKILLIAAASIFIVVGMLGWLNVRVMKETVSEEIDDLLESHLNFAAKTIGQTTQDTQRTAEIIAHNPTISKALDLGVSVGVSGVLNDLVKIYPFFNYILVVTLEGDVFAVNTNDSIGAKIPSEELLGSSVLDTPAFLYLLQHETFVPDPAPDPFLPQLGIQSRLSQWFVAPVSKASRIIGYLVISYNWEDKLFSLLKSIREDLLSQDNPVLEVALLDASGNLVVGSDQTREKMISSSDQIRKQRPLSFGKTTMNLVIASDKARINEPVTRAAISSLAIAGVAAVILLGVFYLIIRKTFVAKLQALHDGTSALRQGDLSYRLPSLGNDELGALASTFNIMGESLQKASQDLELKVEQRTAELAVTNQNLLDEIAERKKTQEELAQKTALLSGLLDSIPDMVFFKDANCTFLGCNSEFERYVGAPRNAIIGKTNYDLFTKEDADAFTQSDQMILEHGSAQRYERLVDYPDGLQVVVESFKSPLKNVNGDVIGIVGVSRDITERKRAEQKLRDNEQTLNSILEASAVGIAFENADRTIRWVNRSWLEIMGYQTVEQVNGLNYRIFYPTEDEYQRLGSIMSSSFAQGTVASTDGILMRKSGETFDAHIRATPFDVSDLARGFVSVIEDITSRKKAEREVKDTKAQFDAFMEHSPTLAFMKDDKGHYIYANKKWLSTFGLLEKDWYGKTSSELFPSDIAAKLVETDNISLERNDVLEYVLPITGPDGNLAHW
ncbi:MAG: PAS domain S-box protein, partial [Desulfomonilaceae bacterium]